MGLKPPTWQELRAAQRVTWPWGPCGSDVGSGSVWMFHFKSIMLIHWSESQKDLISILSNTLQPTRSFKSVNSLRHKETHQETHDFARPISLQAALQEAETLRTKVWSISINTLGQGVYICSCFFLSGRVFKVSHSSCILLQVEQIRNEKKELEDQLQAEMAGASNESDRLGVSGTPFSDKPEVG